MAEHEHEKKATQKMEEMARLERAWEHCEHDTCWVPCMSVARASSIMSTIDNARNFQKCKAVIDVVSTDHKWSAFRRGMESCLTCLEQNLLCTWKNWVSGHKYMQCNACHTNTLRKKCW